MQIYPASCNDKVNVYRNLQITVTVTINGLVKLSAFNAHICPSKYLQKCNRPIILGVNTNNQVIPYERLFQQGAFVFLDLSV